MKTFKRYLSESKQPKKYDDFVNGHGSHAKEKMYDDFVNGHGSHAKEEPKKKEIKNKKMTFHQDYFFDERVQESILGNILKPNINKFLSKNHNSHFGGDDYDVSDNDLYDGHLYSGHYHYGDQMKHLENTHSLSDKPEESQNAVNQYTLSSGLLNGELIDHHNDGKEAPEKVGGINVHHLDNAFQKSKIKTHTFSGAGFDIRNTRPSGKTKNGNTVYHSPGYISSSHDPHVAKNFADTRSQSKFFKPKNRQILHIETGEGHHILPIGSSSNFEDENETLHPRNSHYEHIKTTTHKDNKGNLYDVHHLRRIHPSELIK